MYVYILAGLAILAAIVIVVVGVKAVRKQKARRRRQQEREANRKASEKRLKNEVQQWIERIEAAQSDEEILEAGAYPLAVRHLEPEGTLEEALRKYTAAKERNRRRTEIDEYAAKYAAATPAGKADLCIEMRREHYLSDVLGLTDDEVGWRVVELMLEELSAAREGDASALLRFLNFRTVNRIDNENSSILYFLNEKQKASLAIPGDWDDLVTELLETPSIHDFQLIQRQPAPGAIRLLAAKALDERSLKLGKIVLAFCSVREDVMGTSGYRGGQSRQAVWPYRQEIGDVLLAEVTKMVYAIHSERNMSYAR